MTDIKLGNTVSCVITGFTGTATQLCEMLSGTVQFGVQPRARDGETDKMPDPIAIDVQNLKLEGNGFDYLVVPADDVRLPLGIEVRDTVTGLTGVTIEKITYMNGCTRYVVQPPKIEGQSLLGELPAPHFFDWKRLVPVQLKDKQALSASAAAANIATSVRSGLSGLSGMFRSAEVAPEPVVEPLTTPKTGKGGPNRRAERF